MPPLFSPKAPALNLKSANSFALLHRMECRACPLNSTKNGKMTPTGAVSPLVYVLGEAPDANEIELREQFVGDSGQLLRSHVPKKYRAQLRFNNVVRSRPPGNATPAWQEIEACRPSVVKDIEAAKPKAILGFGNVPLEWASEFTGILMWRGRRMPVKVGNHTCWYYPMLHPSYLLRNRRRDSISEEERMFKFDMRRFFEEVEHLPPPKVHTAQDVRDGVEIVNGDLSALERWFDWALQQPVIGLDYETNGLRPYAKGAKILSAALATEEKGFAFALRHPESEWEDVLEVEALWVDFLEKYEGVKVAHNLAFELEWTGYFFGWELLRTGRWEDTAVQAVILDERTGRRGNAGPLSLEFLVQQYYGFNLKKLAGVDRKNLEKTPIEAVLYYNAPDSKYAAGIWAQQRDRITELGLDEAYELALRRVPTCVLTQAKGVPADQAEVVKLQKKYGAELERIEGEIAVLPIIREFVKREGRGFNPLSNPDVLRVLKDYLKRTEVLVVDKFTKKTKYSADKAVLEQIDHPLAELLLKLREYTKRKSTYVDPLRVGDPASVMYPDGLSHAQFNTLFAETGRLSCVREGTRIQVPGGTKAIEDVVPGDLVYAFDDDLKLVLRKVLRTWSNGKKQVLRLHWSGTGGQHTGSLDVTADHPIRLATGEYVPAGELSGGVRKWSTRDKRWFRSGGERVMSLSRGQRGGRNDLYPTHSDSCKEARFVFEEVNGWSPEHVHHKDGDKTNDIPSNLEGLTHKAHASLHLKQALSVPGEAQRRAALVAPEVRAKQTKALVASNRARARTLTREEVEEALKVGKGIKGARKILGCDYSTIRNRISLWGLEDWSGHSMRNERPEQRKRRGPYKGRSEYQNGYRSKYDGAKNNHRITWVEPLEGLYPVYDLEVEGVHNFIANEICVHNCSEPNWQNIPKRNAEARELRRQVVAKTRHLIVAVDYGQIEARVIAMATLDELFTKALWERYDIHMEWAERLAAAYPARIGGKKNLTDKKAMKDFRTDVKNQWTFPLFFGAKLSSAAGYLKMPEDTIKPLYDEFWRQFSGVKAWQDGLLKFYHEHGYVECLTGRRRRGPLSLNQIYNSPIQGSAAEIVMDAMCRLSETGDPELQPNINIHDDLTYIDVPVERVDTIAERIVGEMLRVPFKWAQSVPISVEMSVGENWLEMEEVATYSSDEWGLHD